MPYMGLQMYRGEHVGEALAISDPERGMYLVDVESGEVRELVTEPGTYGELSWSPDGESLVFSATLEGRQVPMLYSVEAGNGHVRPIDTGVEGATERAEYPAWSPAGGRIAFAQGRGPRLDLHLMEVETGVVTQLTYTTDAAESDPRSSPDGQWVMYHAWDLLEKVGRLLVTDGFGSARIVLGAGITATGGSWAPSGDRVVFSGVRWVVGPGGVAPWYHPYVVDLAGQVPMPLLPVSGLRRQVL